MTRPLILKCLFAATIFSASAVLSAWAFGFDQVTSAVQTITNLGPSPRPHNSYLRFHSPEGAFTRKVLGETYKKELVDLAVQVRADGAKLVMVYVPCTTPDMPEHLAEPQCRELFVDAAKEAGIEYIDLSDTWRQHDPYAVTMLPWDGHPSTYGHRVIAMALADLLPDDGHRTVRKPDTSRPWGDTKPGRLIHYGSKDEPYIITGTEQGTRWTPDTEGDRRVLVLGDSFSFGYYVRDAQAWPSLFADLTGDRVVNAAVVGTTISQQAELYRERARHSAPDLVILQVLDNDFHAMTAWNQNLKDRHGRRHKPTPAEQALYGSN